MADLFDQIENIIGNSVELFFSNQLWTVRVIEDGAATTTTYEDEAPAVQFAEAEMVRLGLTRVIRL
ncbi:hypothetical protein [Rhizobium sp. Leaf262]|uniref:hypothetical protein n=1 Tax=Rhizobium sp. Leaf262 TaxID=1736312 RepID=UPI00071252D3|nr:hypothetical protein [Rhizobium sp. Leaf262]KQO79431.1 hypothetical protein ASF29_23255 [Rhizobium sp. Leaf262]